MEITLHLPEQKFNDRPTKSQTSNMLHDIVTFQNKVLGSLIAAGDYTVTDPWIAQAFNATVQLKAAKDMLDGVSTAGMPQPQPGRPQAVPGR